MGREYPRFLYAEPVDTKSVGPFIIHTLFPQLIAKLTFAEDGFHQLNALEVFAPTDDRKVSDVLSSMHSWYTARRMKEAHLSEDFYVRTSEIAEKLAATQYFEGGIVKISMTFKPVMGSQLEIGTAKWRVTIDFANDDTYESTIEKMKQTYREKYELEPDWSSFL